MDRLKSQFNVLNQLRKIDEKIVRVRGDIEEIPREIEKFQASLRSQKAQYDQAKSSFDTCEKKLRKAEQDLREKEDKLQKAESKMMEVKTNEEYQAAMKENESQKKEKAGLEDQVLQLITEVEEQRGKLKEIEKELKTFEAGIKKDLDRLEEEQKTLGTGLDALVAQRVSFTSQLEGDVAELYRKVVDRIHGVAVVAAENGMCVACNMKLRPQLYNELLGFKAIHRCPSCNRILIIVPSEAEAPQEWVAK